MSLVAVRTNTVTGLNVPQHLLDRGRQQGRVVGKPGLLCRMVHQRERARGDQVAGGVAAGVDQQQEEEVELQIGESLSVDLGLQE